MIGSYVVIDIQTQTWYLTCCASKPYLCRYSVTLINLRLGDIEILGDYGEGGGGGVHKGNHRREGEETDRRYGTEGEWRPEIKD